MSESETSKQKPDEDTARSAATGFPQCLPIAEMFKQMAGGCQCSPAGFKARSGEETEAASSVPAE